MVRSAPGPTHPCGEGLRGLVLDRDSIALPSFWTRGLRVPVFLAGHPHLSSVEQNTSIGIGPCGLMRQVASLGWISRYRQGSLPKVRDLRDEGRGHGSDERTVAQLESDLGPDGRQA